jgi:hypothetical protein
MIMTSHDPIPAILDQLATHTEQITGHSRLLHAHSTALTELASALPDGSGPDGYQPEAAPQWWMLPPSERAEPLARLRGWVERVYRPGYGHLAAALAPCWEAHDLCLYGLDIASELWSALYLQPERSPALLSAQAEYQVRILPALAAQLAAETSRCGHTRIPVRSMP